MSNNVINSEIVSDQNDLIKSVVQDDDILKVIIVPLLYYFKAFHH